MNKHQLRALALRDPEQFRRHIRGARERELAARYFLLHPERIASASAVELEALREYIHDRGWRSLYGHDRRMYRFLRAGAEKLRNNAGLNSLEKEMKNGLKLRRLRDLPEDERNEFTAWLTGRAAPALSDKEGNLLPEEQQDGYYEHDYQTWKASMLPPGSHLILEGKSGKVLLNEAGIVFFGPGQQHSSVKLPRLSYEDDYKGNSLAGTFRPGRVDIRFHEDFSDERVWGIWQMWKRLCAKNGLTQLEPWEVYYQGRKL
jgi:hypothetical protein